MGEYRRQCNSARMEGSSRACLLITWVLLAVAPSITGSKIPRIMAVTETPFGATVASARFSCLVSKQEEKSTVEIGRFVRQGANVSAYSLDLPPGSLEQSASNQIRRVYLPVNSKAQGTFTCGLLKDGQRYDVPITLLHAERRLQAQDGKSTRTINAGDRVFLRCEKVVSATLTGLVWTRLSDFVTVRQLSMSHLISSASSSDSDVYGCYVNGLLSEARLGVVRLIVRGCPAGKWGPPLCNSVCDLCYNGGVCDDSAGECVCPPGFNGPNCLNICNEDSFGWECEFSCGPGLSLHACQGSHLCMPDPYGCSCAAGYTGTYCMEACPDGTFGAGCTQVCHCASGECLAHSGECVDTEAGCAEGWSGTNCQVPGVCPFGYYSPLCTDKCHCEEDSPCDKDTGYCSSTDGNCAQGYVSSTGVNLGNCQKFIGCHSQCTRTCHCSGGDSDCIIDGEDMEDNGMCLSQNCEDAWTGRNCDSGIIEQTSGRANPGETFLVTCTVVNARLQPTDIADASHLRQVSPTNDTDFPVSSSSNKFLRLHGRFFGYGRQEYLVSGIQPVDKLLCVHEVDGVGIAVAEVMLNFYKLPRLSSPPVLLSSGPSWLEVMWPAWNSSEGDTGEGPVVSYRLYVKQGNTEWQLAEVLPHDDNTTSHSLNITDRVQGSTYQIGVSVSREGSGGEGEMSDVLTVSLGAVGPDNTEGAAQTSRVSLIIFILLCIVSFILLIALILLIIFRRRAGTSKRSKSFVVSGYGHAEETATRALPTDVAGDEPDAVTASEDTSIDEPVLPKPVAAVKPSIKKPQYPPVLASEFPQYFWASLESGLLEKQFQALPEDLTQPCLVARREEHKQRNRYRNILAYDHNRVILEDGDDPVNGYINASYVKDYDGEQRYIASQGPNTASVNDFWKMIWQEDVGKIVMATNLSEDGKNKCYKYWPDVGEDALQFGTVLVTTVEEDLLDSCMRRRISITKGEESKHVFQFHYVGWPDKDIPRDTAGVLRFLDVVNSTPTEHDGPVVIHCSAGAGRSGVLLAVAIQQQRVEASGEVDIFNCVLAMRGERPWMVQTPDQYIFVHKLLMEWLLCRDTYIRREDFLEYSIRLTELNPETDETGMRHQFEVLNQILPVSKIDPKAKALQPENEYKNRDPNIIPVNRYRPFLMTAITDDPDSTNYINASFLDGMSTQSEFIVTQMPLPHTIVDIWRLVHDYQIRTIIMLNNMDKKDETCLPYWGRDEPLVCSGHFRITVTALEKQEDMVQRTLILENLLTKSMIEVEQFQIRRWPNHQLRPPSMARLGEFIRLVRDHQESGDSSDTLLVHCMFGASRSGVFCAALSCIKQLEETGGVDVIQTIKQLKQCQPLLVQTEEEYRLVYDIITLYLSQGEGNPEDSHMYENLPPESSATPAERRDSKVIYENLGLEPKDSSIAGMMDSRV